MGWPIAYSDSEDDTDFEEWGTGEPGITDAGRALLYQMKMSEDPTRQIEGSQLHLS